MPPKTKSPEAGDFGDKCWVIIVKENSGYLFFKNKSSKPLLVYQRYFSPPLTAAAALVLGCRILVLNH